MSTRQDLKDRLFEAALANVPFDGWSRKTLRAAADEAGVAPADALRLFPQGGDDLNRHLDDWADRKMLARLEAADLEAMPVRKRVAFGVRARLEALAPHKEAVRRAASGRLRPNLAGDGARGVWRTADLIWIKAGDTATDHNRQTKRGLLAAVQVTTFLYWLEDRSEGHADTWAFLDRRIDDVLRLGGMGRRLGGLGSFGRRPSGGV